MKSVVKSNNQKLVRLITQYGNLLYGKVNPSVLIGSFLVTDHCHGNGHLLCIFVFESRPANSLISRARVPYNKLLTNRS